MKEQVRNRLFGVTLLWGAAVLVLRLGAAAVCSGGPCQAADVDVWVLTTLYALRQPGLDAFFAAVTWLGSIAVLLPAALALAWRLAQRGHGRAALLLPSAVAGAWALAHLGKALIERPRPDLFPAVIAMPADASFPSAHAMQVTAFALAWLLAPHQRAGWTLIVAVATLSPTRCDIAALLASAFSKRCLDWHACRDCLGARPAARADGSHMRHKFLGTGEPGYHPLSKLHTVFCGLRCAVVYDFTVTYKLVLSVCILALAFFLRAWLISC